MKLITFITFLILTSGVFAQTNICRWALTIPVYPEMVPAGTFSSHTEFHSPFITRFKTFKPKEGVEVDKDAVIQFYKDFYSQRGWNPSDWRQESKFPYLQMEVRFNNVHEAEFQLWISPDGELLTIYMSERRAEHFSPYVLPEREKIFNRIAKQNNCTVSKASSFGREAYYENEFLQTCEYFSFYHDSRISGLPLSGCCNPSGRFSAVFLMYKNKQAAKAQKEKWDLEASKYKHIEHIDNDDGTGSTTIRSWWNQIVIQDENILIKIDNSDKNQTNLVSKVATEIKNYSNQYRDSRVGGTIYSGYPLVHEAGVRPTR